MMKYKLPHHRQPHRSTKNILTHRGDTRMKLTLVLLSLLLLGACAETTTTYIIRNGEPHTIPNFDGNCPGNESIINLTIDANNTFTATCAERSITITQD